MPTYASLDAANWMAVVDSLRAELREARSLEQAARHIASKLQQRFADTTALVRVYAIAKYSELPADVRSFVDQVAEKAGDRSRIVPDLPVLTLLGTHGARPSWCDRKQSQAHKGIPLLSGAFVDGIPMLARLLRELGIDLSWLDDAPEISTRRLLGGFNGVFYVQDAPTARDAKGRRIIPASDFVSEQGVRTVFGTGGFYPDGTLVVCIVFTRETLERAVVDRLASLISMVKGETFGIVRARKLFD